MAGLAGPKATSFSVVPSAPIEIGQIAGQIPVDLADRQAKIAQAQADAATARATQQTAGPDATERVAQDDDAALKRLVLVARSNPAVAGSPMLAQAVGTILQRRGASVDSYMTPEGTINLDALQGVVTPAKLWTDATATEKQANRALPADQREQFVGAPPDYLTAPAVNPMSSASLDRLNADLSAKEKLLGDAKNGYSPAAFLADVKYKEKLLRAAGMDADADAIVSSYLAPDGQSLSDGFKEKVVGPLVEAEMSNLHSLGIYRTDETALRAKMLQEHLKEFDANYGLRRDNFNRLQQKDAREGAIQQQRLAISQQNLNATLMRVQNQAQQFQQNYGLRANSIAMGGYKALLGNASKQLADSEHLLASVSNAITQRMNSPNFNAAAPDFKALVQQASDLQATIAKNKPFLEQEQSMANQAVAQTVQNITGNQTTNPSPAPSAPTVVETRKLPNGQTWQKLSDGTFRQAQ